LISYICINIFIYLKLKFMAQSTVNIGASDNASTKATGLALGCDVAFKAAVVGIAFGRLDEGEANGVSMVVADVGDLVRKAEGDIVGKAEGYSELRNGVGDAGGNSEVGLNVEGLEVGEKLGNSVVGKSVGEYVAGDAEGA
jgi:hypothetical protein